MKTSLLHFLHFSPTKLQFLQVQDNQTTNTFMTMAPINIRTHKIHIPLQSKHCNGKPEIPLGSTKQITMDAMKLFTEPQR